MWKTLHSLILLAVIGIAVNTAVALAGVVGMAFHVGWPSAIMHSFWPDLPWEWFVTRTDKFLGNRWNAKWGFDVERCGFDVGTRHLSGVWDATVTRGCAAPLHGVLHDAFDRSLSM